MDIPVPVRIVDAFAERRFTGNPAGVCILPADYDEAWAAAVAAELNLSETAFLVQRDEATWSLRWWTPVTEVPLCGHATLAAAHVLWTEGRAPRGSTVTFRTRSGELYARQRDDVIEIDLPANPATPGALVGLGEALGAEPVEVLVRPQDAVAVFEDAATVRDLAPDTRALARLVDDGVIVTAPGDDEDTDYVVRYFAPGVGLDEDPVTGYAQTVVGPYWANRLGRDTLHAHQLSRRGGRIVVVPAGDRVALAGRAVTVLTGALLQD